MWLRSDDCIRIDIVRYNNCIFKISCIECRIELTYPACFVGRRAPGALVAVCG
jgi:hypothetical protein